MRDRQPEPSITLRDLLSLRLVRWLIGMLLVAGVLLGIAYCTAESMLASRPVEVGMKTDPGECLVRFRSIRPFLVSGTSPSTYRH